MTLSALKGFLCQIKFHFTQLIKSQMVIREGGHFSKFSKLSFPH